MIAPVQAGRELASLLAEVTDVDWRHPAWIALVAGTALLESLARRAPRKLAEDSYTAYVSANGGPRSDTLMARDREATERIARALVRARAASAALQALDGSLPGQPLLRALARAGGWLRRIPATPATAAFVTPRGVYHGDLSRPGPLLARALGAACAGRSLPPGAPLRPIDGRDAASIAVDLSPQPFASARHLHRRAWSASRGPWLGAGDAPGLEVVTTCHLVVDGFGHALIADRIFRALDAWPAADLDALVAAARQGLAGAAAFLPEAPAVAGARPLALARRVIDGSGVQFPQVAGALGRALARLRRSPGRFGPTFQIAVAPGARWDARRHRRRVMFGLLALRAGESDEALRGRLRGTLEREAAGDGLLMRILAATAEAPLPSGLKRRLLATGGAPSRWLPPVATLAGRASLSLIRFPDGPRPATPLYGVSSPPLEATRADPDGSVVVTIVDHGGPWSVAVAGTGTLAVGEVMEALGNSFRANQSAGG